MFDSTRALTRGSQFRLTFKGGIEPSVAAKDICSARHQQQPTQHRIPPRSACNRSAINQSQSQAADDDIMAMAMPTPTTITTQQRSPSNYNMKDSYKISSMRHHYHYLVIMYLCVGNSMSPRPTQAFSLSFPIRRNVVHRGAPTSTFAIFQDDDCEDL